MSSKPAAPAAQTSATVPPKADGDAPATGRVLTQEDIDKIKAEAIEEARKQILAQQAQAQPTRSQGGEDRLLRGHVKDPDRHYVKIQKDGAGYEGRFEERMMEESLVRPGHAMWRVESDDRRVTGDTRFVLISCSQADYREQMRRIEAESRGRQSAVEPDEEISGGILSA